MLYPLCRLRVAQALADDPQDVELRRLLAERDALYARLPEGMKHCTILFKECERGHGRLTATNWAQHGCPTCALADLQAACEACLPAVMHAQWCDYTRYHGVCNCPRHHLAARLALALAPRGVEYTTGPGFITARAQGPPEDKP